MTKEQVLVRVLARLPYSNQITEVDLSSEREAIRFTWRGNRFRVTNELYTEEVQGGCLAGSNIALILRDLLRRTE